MSTTEELWFLIAIGGILVFLEGAITFVAKTLLKGRIREDLLKVVAGLAIFTLAVIYLFNLPPAK